MDLKEQYSKETGMETHSSCEVYGCNCVCYDVERINEGYVEC